MEDPHLAYSKLIEKAKTRPKPKGYVERHHVLPRSLGGDNSKSNIVVLTAREHFIAHKLLVEMHKPGTEARKKMMYAFWRMKGGNKEQKRAVDPKAYEKFRKEHAKYVSDMSAESQRGSKNSQYGTSWWTEKSTGKSAKSKTCPGKGWILGRNVYGKKFGIRNSNQWNEEKRRERMDEARLLWDEYHSGEYRSVAKFAKGKGMNPKHLHLAWRTWLPAYKRQSKTRGCGFPSNKKFVKVYD